MEVDAMGFGAGEEEPGGRDSALTIPFLGSFGG